MMQRSHTITPQASAERARPATLADCVAGLACEMQFDGVWHGGAIKSARDVEGGRRQVSFAYRRHKGVQQDLVLPDDLDVLRVPTAAAAAKRPRGAAAPAPRKKPRVAVGTVVEKVFKAVSATRKFRGAVVGPAAKRSGSRRWRVRYDADGYVETLTEAAILKLALADDEDEEEEDDDASYSEPEAEGSDMGSVCAEEPDALDAAQEAASPAPAAEAPAPEPAPASPRAEPPGEARRRLTTAAREPSTPRDAAATKASCSPLDIIRVSTEIAALSPAAGDDGIAVAQLKSRLASLPDFDAVLKELERSEKVMCDQDRIYPI